MQRYKLIAVLFTLALLIIALPGVATQSALAQPEELWEEFPLDSDKSPPPEPEGQRSPAPEEKQTAPQTSAPPEGDRAANDSGRDGLPLWLLPVLGLLAFLGGIFATKAALGLIKSRRERRRRAPAQPLPPSRKERLAPAQADEPARAAPAVAAKKAPAKAPASKTTAPAPEQSAEPAKPKERERPATAEPVEAKVPAEPVEAKVPVPAEPVEAKVPAPVELVKAEGPAAVKEKRQAPAEPEKTDVLAPLEPVKAEGPAAAPVEPDKAERPSPAKPEPTAPVKPKRPAPVEAERSEPEQPKPKLADFAPPQRSGGLPDDVIPFPTRPGRIGKRPAKGSPRLALGYVSAADAESQSGELETQTEQIRAACVRNGFDSVEVVRDFESHSGSDLERPGLIYALERLEAGEASALVVASLERLTRSAAHLGTLIDRLGESGIRLVVLDIELDTGDPDGRLAAEALANVGTLERKSLDIRTRKGLQAAREGRRSSGRPAVADRPALKERIADMRARGMTLQAIADTLNSEGVPTLRGGAEWRPSSVQAAVGYKRPKRGARKAGNGSAEGSSERNGGSSEGSLPTNSR